MRTHNLLISAWPASVNQNRKAETIVRFCPRRTSSTTGTTLERTSARVSSLQLFCRYRCTSWIAHDDIVVLFRLSYLRCSLCHLKVATTSRHHATLDQKSLTNMTSTVLCMLCMYVARRVVIIRTDSVSCACTCMGHGIDIFNTAHTPELTRLS